MKIKILKTFSFLNKEFKEGQELEIATDDSGIPVEKAWRRMIKDAALDGNIEEVIVTKKTKKEE